MVNQRVSAMVAAGSFLIMASAGWSQIVRVDFSAEVTELAGSPLPDARVGSTITGRVEVDLATLPADFDEQAGVGGYLYAGGHPGMTLRFTTGGQTVTYDSINAAGDPGLIPMIILYDEVSFEDYLGFQFRDQGGVYSANLSFEDYQEPRTLLSGDYFPDSVNLPWGADRARFEYSDEYGANVLRARNVSATITVDVGEGVTALLRWRVNQSDLSGPRKRALLSTLEAAEAALAAGDCETGLQRLATFQHKLRAQVERTDPLLAGRLIGGAEAIILRECAE